LLQYHLRKPDPVRVVGVPPGEVAVVAVVPPDEFTAEIQESGRLIYGAYQLLLAVF
jgi:hypothetical protein